MKKNIFIGLLSGFVAMFCFAYFTNADVALPENVGLPNGTLTSVVSNLTNWLLGIFGFVAIISFLVSGMMYFFSAGDDKTQEKAKKQMTWSIAGVVVGLVGLVVIYTVNMLLNGGSASFGSSSVINDAANSPMTGASVPTTPTPTNTTEWLGEGQIINPDGSPGNRTFIDQQGRSFELKNGSLIPMNDSSADVGPDSSYQP